MDNFLKFLNALAAISVIAFVGYFFMGEYSQRQALARLQKEMRLDSELTPAEQFQRRMDRILEEAKQN